MYGDKAFDLIRELDRTAADTIPLYNSIKYYFACRLNGICSQLRYLTHADIQWRQVVHLAPLSLQGDSVRQILDEVRNLYERNQEDVNASVSGDPSFFAAVHLRHAALERNKRCLLAYLYNRLQRIRDLRWDFGSVLPVDIMDNLCDQEVQWLNSYNKSLATYMRGLGGKYGLDLTQDTRPPKSLCLEVRCTQDYGLLELEDGDVVMLKKDTTHLLPRAECLPLIRQGVLEHVPH